MHEGMAANVQRQLIQLRDQERRLLEQLRQRSPVARNLNVEHAERRPFGDRLADRVATTVGSWRFVMVQSVLLAAWIVFNSVAWFSHWDPYPRVV